MNGPVKYRGIVVEDVPGAPWMIGYGWPDSGVLGFAVIRACPDYASDELRLACWDGLVASVRGVCNLCGAVASTPSELKTAPPDVRGFVGRCLLAHRDACPCSDERLKELDRRDSPDGLGTPTDFSEESQNTLAAFLTVAAEVLS